MGARKNTQYDNTAFLSWIELALGIIGGIKRLSSSPRFDGYRDFVIAMLPNLDHLDGTDIEHGERIRAVQKLDELRPLIARQEDEYRTGIES